MFTCTCGHYTLLLNSDGLPDMSGEYVRHAQLADEHTVQSARHQGAFIAVRKGNDWPFLVVTMQYSPSEEAGFHPGVALIPETETLFIGAGERLLAYRLNPPSRLWEDQADTGFWGWERVGEFVLMSAELELAAWNLEGRKLWSTFVEPPWEYSISGDAVHLDVMGQKSSFSLQQGPMRQ
jgi:hypothetical protein